ncbi:hypothetical protein C3B44_00235 [Corynebacterium yudongzhengii]|uniref:MerR family DNA-binding transcriptional regulator n=1 Tax=Corynebacterium yudongzhengii TaxID=2080740 RepID=A0A2U1T526_9CORY|nr:MerR family transcriptional regulator [Corynebacterium yudongzhengii]AWB80970.1 hypothetical protein C3B44_00235 [Corynebacterium yudongzhengii]PWC01104.1 MerR family DNA-binding transcriptional regulator [Corynebacterium yudongzhengii]
MPIGMLSERLGMSVPTIKYYVREGLIPPPSRVSVNQADYTEDHFYRLTLINLLTVIGEFKLEQIREILGLIDKKASVRKVVGVMLTLRDKIFPFERGGDEKWAAQLLLKEGVVKESHELEPMERQLQDLLASTPEEFQPVVERYFARYVSIAKQISELDAQFFDDLAMVKSSPAPLALFVVSGVLMRRRVLDSLITGNTLATFAGSDTPLTFDVGWSLHDDLALDSNRKSVTEP